MYYHLLCPLCRVKAWWPRTGWRARRTRCATSAPWPRGVTRPRVKTEHCKPSKICRNTDNDGVNANTSGLCNVCLLPVLMFNGGWAKLCYLTGVILNHFISKCKLICNIYSGFDIGWNKSLEMTEIYLDILIFPYSLCSLTRAPAWPPA